MGVGHTNLIAGFLSIKYHTRTDTGKVKFDINIFFDPMFSYYLGPGEPCPETGQLAIRKEMS